MLNELRGWTDLGASFLEMTRWVCLAFIVRGANRLLPLRLLLIIDNTYPLLVRHEGAGARSVGIRRPVSAQTRMPRTLRCANVIGIVK